MFFSVYFPNVAQGMVVHVRPLIACPDIETHAGQSDGHALIQFTVDVYTQTGVMATVMLNPQ